MQSIMRKNIATISVILLLCFPLASAHALTENSNPNGHGIVDSSQPNNSTRYKGGNIEEGVHTEDNTSHQNFPAQEKASQLDDEAVRQARITEFNKKYSQVIDNAGNTYYAPKDGSNNCLTDDYRPGESAYSEYTLEDGMAVQTLKRGGGVELSRFCKPNDAKTFTSNDPAQPKGPTIEEMLQEIEDQFAKTDIQAPVLKQSYNLGTGLGEDNPNVYKNQAVNFYVDAPTARWEGDLMIGHVEMESYPIQMTIQYGNGDEGSFYTMGKPVSRARGEEARKTATSYVYKRSGNFHAYATVSYAGRYRVNGGPWQAMRTVVKKDTAEPLLIRVWWTDVGRVAGDCSYDDTRWGCKNDPTMGKPDNPNPRLRKADIRTGQRWHLNDNGDGDTEYSLHRDWPDM